MPLVSIVVPVHNTAPYLEECVNSLLAQTIADRLEIILVENASTDDSPAICRALAASHPATIRLLTLDRGDVSLARNEGVKAATGKYIGFVDSDDTVAPDMYEQLVTAKEKYGADIACCNFAWVENGKFEDVFHSSGEVKILTPAEAMIDAIANNGKSSPCTRLYDKAFFLTRRFPEHVRWEDHRVIYRWMGEAQKVVYLYKALYHYHSHGNSYTCDSRVNPIKILDRIEAEGGRVSVIGAYPKFTRSQRHQALNACVKNLIYEVVQYITISGVAYASDIHVMAMRKEILRCSRPIMPWQIDLFQWLQLMRLRFTWTQFFTKQVSRRDASA